MSEQSIDALAHMEGAPQLEQLFPVEREYARCVTALNRTGILTLLQKFTDPQFPPHSLRSRLIEKQQGALSRHILSATTMYGRK